MLLRLRIFDAPGKTEPLFDDGMWWETPDDFTVQEERKGKDGEAAGEELMRPTSHV